MTEFILLYALVTFIGLALFFFVRRLADVNGPSEALIAQAEVRADAAIEKAEEALTICAPRALRQAKVFLKEARKCRAYNQSGWHPFATRNSTWRKRVRAKSKADFATIICTGRIPVPKNRTLISF